MIPTAKHYDVVVLGGGLGALASAALLARRSWRVLVLGQGFRRPTYTYDGLALARRPFAFLAASSPAWTRVTAELAQSQIFRRRLSSLDPMLQVLGPGLRLDIPPDPQLFARELERELGSARRVIDDLYAELARANAAADAAFERDAVWPPGGFWERRETGRILATLPWASDEGRSSGDLLGELPRGHVFREILATTARFASDLAGELPRLAVARLHGAWTRGVSALPGGEDELVEFLLERVRAHGGETRLGDRASALLHEGGKVRGVHVDGDEHPVGVTFVVSDLPAAAVLELAPSFAAPRDREAPALDVAEGRFVVSIVARPEGVPAPLAQHAFLLPARGPAVHLSQSRGARSGTVLLVAEALVPSGAALEGAREEVVAAVLEHLPFLERHMLLCDSPHDGRPLWDFRGTTRSDPRVGPASWGLRARPIERALLRAGGGALEPEPMLPRFTVTPPWLSGLAGEPLRVALGNTFVVGRSTLPALGQEGELLAAWGVSRAITRTDRKKEKMLREMWSKVELP